MTRATVTYCGTPDMVGKTFGRLTVLGPAPRRGKTRGAWWECSCACGRLTAVKGMHLRSGNTRSCGCLHAESSARRLSEQSRRHGMRQSPTYGIWAGMRERCQNVNAPAYANYGGRGIKVCDRWKKFENFIADLGERPAGMSLDRIDNDGNYEPGNCRWATREEQNNNQRKTVWLEHRGERKTKTQWARALGISLSTLHNRLKVGWSVAAALDTPVRALRRAA